ncbi:MAG: YwiC-like family protein [Verrucomicrobiae bacterium]|nr:YwiC-like family protein [Verrucomicrobiae bacterium]
MTPREHGAWGILLVPLATAVGVAGQAPLPFWLLLAATICVHMARANWLKKNRRWACGLLVVAGGCGAALLIGWQRGWVIPVACALAPLWWQKTRHHIAWQVVAVLGLTTTAPVGWYVIHGRWDLTALWLWVLNAGYFIGGVLHVRMHVAAAVARRVNRREQATANLVYHGLLAAGAAATWPAGAAWLPAVMRAVWGAWRLQPQLAIRRLGWTEVAYSLGFGVLVVYLNR